MSPVDLQQFAEDERKRRFETAVPSRHDDVEAMRSNPAYAARVAEDKARMERFERERKIAFYRKNGLPVPEELLEGEQNELQRPSRAGKERTR